MAAAKKTSKPAQKKTAAPSKALSAEDLLTGGGGFELREVQVPEWGGVVYVRELSEFDYMDWIEESRAARELRQVQAQADGEESEAEEDAEQDEAAGQYNASISLLRRTLCDENGELLFHDDQILQLRNKSVRVINRCVDAALDINGLKVKDEEELVGKLKESDSRTG